MDRYLTGNRASVHEVGLMDLFDISRLSGTFPEHRALIGVEPESLGWGDYPSGCVARQIGPAAAMALATKSLLVIIQVPPKEPNRSPCPADEAPLLSAASPYRPGSSALASCRAHASLGSATARIG